MQESHKMTLELTITRERTRADKAVHEAVMEATDRTNAKVTMQAQQALKEAVASARREEAIVQKNAARAELREVRALWSGGRAPQPAGQRPPARAHPSSRPARCGRDPRPPAHASRPSRTAGRCASSTSGARPRRRGGR